MELSDALEASGYSKAEIADRVEKFRDKLMQVCNGEYCVSIGSTNVKQYMCMYTCTCTHIFALTHNQEAVEPKFSPPPAEKQCDKAKSRSPSPKTLGMT